jgi:hypothetical protein
MEMELTLWRLKDARIISFPLSLKDFLPLEHLPSSTELLSPLELPPPSLSSEKSRNLYLLSQTM